MEKEITLNGVKYIRADLVNHLNDDILDRLEHQIITYSLSDEKCICTGIDNENSIRDFIKTYGIDQYYGINRDTNNICILTRSAYLYFSD